MELPTPDQPTTGDKFYVTDEQYRKDLMTLERARAYMERIFDEDTALSYMIDEIKTYYKNEGKFSDSCYEYADKEKPQLTEAELAEILPKNDDGKPIFSWRDL